MDEEKQRAEVLRIETRRIGLQEFCSSNDFMQASPLLTRLSPAQRELLLQSGQVVGFRTGTQISPPDGCERLGLVLLGTVSLQPSPACEIAVVGPGDVFGIEAVVEQAPRLQAVAGEDVRLAWLETVVVRKLARETPQLEAYLRQKAKHLSSLAEDSEDFLSRW